jgi:transposase
VDNEQRAFLIDLIFIQGIKIKKAAEIAGVGYENAKFISKVFKKEGRNFKKSFKNVKKPRKLKNR